MPFYEPKSAGSDVETPPEIFGPLHRRFRFERDVCATRDNAKLPSYWSAEDDALSQEWEGTLWMNPPYGRKVGDWVAKAFESARSGARVVCLLPVRSDNDWWKFVVRSELWFIRGRTRFVNMKGDTMFPVCVAIFHPRLEPGGIMRVWNFKCGKLPEQWTG